MRRFAHLCGVFAAMGLFVEVAIPTALVLACDRIVQEHETRWRGVEVWAEEKVALQNQHVGMDLRNVIGSYGRNQLYLHPVKLSALASVDL